MVCIHTELLGLVSTPLDLQDWALACLEVVYCVYLSRSKHGCHIVEIVVVNTQWREDCLLPFEAHHNVLVMMVATFSRCFCSGAVDR